MATQHPKRVTTPRFLLTHTVDFEVERSQGGTYVRGVWVPAVRETIPMTGNIQPLRGAELLALPESDRSKESIKVYTVETLKTIDEYGETEADIIVFKGKRYKAVQQKVYEMGVLDHTKTICLRLPETPNRK